jgi:hypothetical protein
MYVIYFFPVLFNNQTCWLSVNTLIFNYPVYLQIYDIILSILLDYFLSEYVTCLNIINIYTNLHTNL